MAKKNCWEQKKCGREVGGLKEKGLGVCPAATNFSKNGRNGGKAAGRYCWKVAETLCGDKVQGTFAEKLPDCFQCDFFKFVRFEEGVDFRS